MPTPRFLETLIDRLRPARPFWPAVPPLTADEALAARRLENPETARERMKTQNAEGWRPRANVERVRIDYPFDWSADPFRDNNWRSQLNAWRSLDVYIAVHAIDGDRDAYHAIVDGMLDWARHERTAPTPNRLWGDMTTGIRTAKLAYVLSQPEFESLAPNIRTALVRLARAHLRKLRRPAFISKSNHALPQIHGMAALMRVAPRLPESRGGQAYVDALLTVAVRRQLGREGVHLEHSPGYHSLALGAFSRLLASGWFRHPELSTLVKRAAHALPWFVFPDGHLSSIGDSSPVRRAIDLPKPTDTTEIGRLFGEAGYAVVRSVPQAPMEEQSMLLVAAGYHSRAHKHADDMTFELFEKGRRLIVDTGKCTYRKGELKAFSKSARAHNVIDMVAERSDNGLKGRAPSGGGIARLEPHAWGWLIEGTIDLPNHAVAHRRRILYRPGAWLVLLDDVASDQPRDLTAWLHLNPAIEAEQASGNAWSFPGGRIDYVSEDPVRLERVRGRKSPLQGWFAAGYERLQPADALAAHWRAQGGRIATRIQIDPEARVPEVVIAEGRFRVSIDGDDVALAGGDLWADIGRRHPGSP